MNKPVNGKTEKTMQYTIHCPDKDFTFDENRLLFQCSPFDLKLSSLFRFSENTSWCLKESAFQECSAKTSGEKLLVGASAESFQVHFEFYFKNDILLGKMNFRARREIRKGFFALCLPVPDHARLTLPMSLYNGNPSTSPERTVARFPPEGKASLLVEESRLPIPGINAETDGKFLTLFLFPGKHCSLGCERIAKNETFLVLGSGCVAFNGTHDCANELKNQAVENPKGYRNFANDECLCLEFAINWGSSERTGEGFRDLVSSGFSLFKPGSKPVCSLDEVIRRKEAALRERWHENGYLCVLPGNLYKRPPYFLFGWAGQAMRLALCDIRYGVIHNDGEAIKRGMKAADLFVTSSQTTVPGLRYTNYFLEEKSWTKERDCPYPVISARALGETWSDLARIILFCNENKIPVPEYFLPALREGLQFMLSHLLAQGITPMFWDEKGNAFSPETTAAGTSFLIALFAMARLTNEKSWMESAENLLLNYWNLGGNDFSTPFAKATLDSGCEDKEAAIPFFVAAAEAWRLTGNSEYRHWAEASADWLLTWVYFWNVPFRKGSICDTYHFKSAGWPAVSVENQHLDVFFPAWELFRFGLDSQNERYMHCGELVFNAWSHGISKGKGDWLFDSPGCQAEQFFQTEWVFSLEKLFDRFPKVFRDRLQTFGYTAENIDQYNRCGGCNPWEISWTIATVLDAALSFKQQQNTSMTENGHYSTNI